MMWHQKQEVLPTLRMFHDKHCREPNFSSHKRYLTTFLREIIDDNLKPQGYCNKVEYVGSCYDGTCIGDNPVFDIIAVIEDSEGLAMKSKGVGRVAIAPKEGCPTNARFLGMTDSNGDISPNKLFDKFKSLLASMTNHSDRMKNAIIRENDSSIVLEIKINESFELSQLVINLTPAFKMEKENDKVWVRSSSKENSWKISWCYKEKALMDGIDRGNACRKQCLRMLKFICKEQSALKKITSYMLKVLLLQEIGDKPDKPWQIENIAERFLDLLQRTELSLQQKLWIDYFEPGINLLEYGINSTALDNMYCRVKRIRESEKEFLTAIHAGADFMEGINTQRSHKPANPALALGSPVGSVKEAVCHESDTSLTVLLREFHEKCARQPQEAMKEAKKKHTHLMRDIIEVDLHQKGWYQRLEFTGSSYEGVKVDNDIEFDVMIIIDGEHVDAIPLDDNPGFALLKPTKKAKSQAQFQKILEPDGHISADKLANKFQSEMQALWNNREELQGTRFRKHGPAVQMDVLTEEGTEWYYVDLVPCYELEDKRRFVAKRPKGSSETSSLGWRRSFSLEEKQLFDGYDADNGCRKKCLRILKVIRNNEPTFQKIASYHLKNILFHEARDNKEGWAQDKLGARIIDLLKRLSEAFRAGQLPCYFLKEVNLLKDISPDTLQNMHNRCQRLLENENRLIALIKKIMEKYP